MTKAEATILKSDLDQVLIYVSNILSLQIAAIKIDIENLTQEE